ncbi:MAG: hypothetical protein JXA10_17620 [Anaerolineae bacterium]|nr:hypothetical protein [Anaerolineae bacterium]
MQMLMFVLDNPDHLDAVLDAWQEVGVSGVTIIESSGLYRHQRQRPVGARYAFGLARSVSRLDAGHYTLLVIVPDVATVEACLAAAEGIVGDLAEPDTGVLAAWELSVVKGVPQDLAQPKRGDAAQDESESERGT